MNTEENNAPENQQGTQFGTDGTDAKTTAQLNETLASQLESSRQQMKSASDLIMTLQDMLKAMPEKFQSGLDRVERMFWIQFSLGILLLFSSVALKIFNFDILTYIFGAAGGLTLVTTFITSSPMRVQKNRVDLAQWGMAFFNWFNTLIATNTVITSAMQAGNLTWPIFRDAHNLLLQVTGRTLWDIENLCEFARNPEKTPLPDPTKIQPSIEEPQPE